MIQRVWDEDKKAEICKQVLEDLPEWFGKPDSLAEYIKESKKMIFWVAYEKYGENENIQNPLLFSTENARSENIKNIKKIQQDKMIQGFIALKKTSEYTVEIYVMGVKKKYHRHHIGQKLFREFYQYAKQAGYEFIQVKTVQKGYYKEYDQTNEFYKQIGFRELECFETLWEKSNPCQIYIMSCKTS